MNNIECCNQKNITKEPINRLEILKLKLKKALLAGDTQGVNGIKKKIQELGNKR